VPATRAAGKRFQGAQNALKSAQQSLLFVQAVSQ
jgi:hypothetical protein